MKLWSFVFSILFFSTFQLVAQEIPKSVFNNNEGNDKTWILYQNNNQTLYKVITNEAFTLLEQREERA